MSIDMDCLIRGQVELQGRIARMVENLRKAGAANITDEAIEARLHRTGQLLREVREAA